MTCSASMVSAYFGGAPNMPEPDSVRVELLYKGIAVDDGTMPVEDMIDALAGFSRAYRMIAHHYRVPETGHPLRVVGLQKGSAKILIDIVDWVIRGKKALQGQSIHNYVFNDNRVILHRVPLTRDEIEVLKTEELDEYLDMMTAPLEEGRGLDEFELKLGDKEVVKVTAAERPYLASGGGRHYWHRGPPEFTPRLPRQPRPPQRTTEEDNVWLEGTFNSHSKRNNRGTFETLSGQRVRYHYVGENIDPLLRAYASGGAVRVLGRVQFDASHEPVSIQIREVHPFSTNPELAPQTR
jgi:hypothetical protein